MHTAEAEAVSASELKALFAGLQSFPVLVLAVSGGPDSTALMVLAERWRRSLKVKPKLVAVTIDHGLRKESKREAAAVARLARKLNIAHRTLRWRGRKPATGLQEAARGARYRLLAEAARRAAASHVLTAHTLDDQAETFLIRLSRGSGLAGLAAMARMARLPVDGDHEISLVRPLLDIPKARLLATLRIANIPFADDPTNRDPRFARVRMRELMQVLAGEGLDAARLARLAERMRRANTAIESAVDAAARGLMVQLSAAPAFAMEARRFNELPSEVALRLLGRAIGEAGDEGPVELAKLEALVSALDLAQNGEISSFRRTLAGAVVTLAEGQIVVGRAPPRRRKALTKRQARPGRSAKTR